MKGGEGREETEWKDWERKKGGNEGSAEWREGRNWMPVLPHDQHGARDHPGASPGVPIPGAP